jgi:hypothetical protein
MGGEEMGERKWKVGNWRGEILLWKGRAHPSLVKMSQNKGKA